MQTAGRRRFSLSAALWLATAALALAAIVPSLTQYAVVGHDVIYHSSRIINIASVAAFIPQPRLAAYSAAKRFMLDISRSLDVELEGVDIHVTAVCPKFMKTEFLDAPGDARSARKMTKIGFERTEEVVRQALRAARAGRGLCIPSLDMKALYAASRVLPYRAAIAVERAIGVL